MLSNLHVKNFAIIDEADIDFKEGLNILTGETGAGKSILIGSLGIALGSRVSPEMIGRRGDSANVEAVFEIHDEKVREKLRALDIEPEEDQIIISRKITEGRSVNRINGESVPAGTIRQVASLCIDIHGQHDHQSLLKTEKQREFVDRFGGEESELFLNEVRDAYHAYAELKREIDEDSLSSEELARQIDFLSYEIQEIEAAALDADEMAEIDEKYRILSHAGTVVEELGNVYRDSSQVAQDAIGRSLQGLRRVSDKAPDLSGYEEQLLEIENLLSDFNRDINDYMSGHTFDEATLRETEQRMDTIHMLQNKYGETYENIVEHKSEAQAKLDKYADYENYRRQRDEKMENLTSELEKASQKLHDRRVESARLLQTQIAKALEDLNFAHVEFVIEVRDSGHFSEKGRDEIEFLIATNPGEEVRPLAKIASGGELSRIMLAIKSVFAESDEIETLIFDEIDTGISGRTAQKVSEKMYELGRHHQILCITHLAQIAAMADTHFVIEKEVGDDASETKIRELSDEESMEELARILGGAKITEATYDAAREMKEMARNCRE